MSRKSTRLQTKRCERETPAILNRKRKRVLELDEKNLELSLFDQTQQNKLREMGFLTPETPDFTKDITWSRFRSLSTLPVSPSSKQTPLPKLSWADPQEVWDVMIRKDKLYQRDINFLKRHPALQANMRSILLDWLIEVCEVYRLHRDTYYLSLDLVDRFLASQTDIPKSQLQLIGITALFVASKIEEIYPPKLSEFAYVTDGACTEQEIIDQELITLKALNWDLTPITVTGWIGSFLQIANLENIRNPASSFVLPQYSSFVLVQVSQLLDLCMLDMGSLSFTYSIIAASALYHTTSADETYRVSGYKWSDICGCVQWMTPFAMTLRKVGPVQPKFFQQISESDMHNIQTHDIDLDILEEAQSQVNFEYSLNENHDFLTPPKSQQKFQSPEASCNETEEKALVTVIDNI